MDVLTNFSDFHIKINEMQKSMRLASEMEKLDDEYYSAYEAAREYLESRQDERCSVSSDILSIDMLEQMNISETNKKEEMGTQQGLRQKGEEAGTVSSNKNNRVTLHILPETSQANETSRSNENELKNKNVNVANLDERHSHLPHTEQKNQYDYEQSNRDSTMKQSGVSGLNARATPFEPALNREAPSIGQDLWRQLKRVQIPVFPSVSR